MEWSMALNPEGLRYAIFVLNYMLIYVRERLMYCTKLWQHYNKDVSFLHVVFINSLDLNTLKTDAILGSVSQWQHYWTTNK